MESGQFLCPQRSGRPPRLRVFASIWFFLLTATSLARADPATDYIMHCRGCHGPEGAGAPGAAPSFRGQVGKFVTVPGGREYLIRVPGTAQSELDDARTAALLNWLLHQFSPHELPDDFTPFTSEEVSRHRRPPLPDVPTARQALIRAMQ